MVALIRSLAALSIVFAASALADPPHNLILFVPDGLRSLIVDETTAPTMAKLRKEGVDFSNSHSLFPTFTTANASAFATGHALGDTGNFSNVIEAGFRVTAAGASVTPFLESDPVLRQVNQFEHDNYLDETSIVGAANAAGHYTAIIGKVGPAAIFDLGALAGKGTLIVDDTTGSAGEVPMSAEWRSVFDQAHVALSVPSRGDNGNPGTWVPNLAQQQYFIEAAVKAVLPHFKESGKPFMLVFWSRDPDGTQHNQGDRLHELTPGINGPTSLAAVRNADTALNALEQSLKALKLYDSTNIIVAADHGFSTISKESHTSAALASPQLKTPCAAGKFCELPVGFLAIDLANLLQKDDHKLRLFDPDDSYKVIDWMTGAHPSKGNAVLGEDADHSQVVVAANGGSDLIYLPSHPPRWANSAKEPPPSESPSQVRASRELARRIVGALLEQDYVSGIFVDRKRFGTLPGALATEDIQIGGGAAVTPHPDIVVSFASKVVKDCDRAPTLCAAEVADTGLAQGQGMHGSFSRADTWNFMAARGPDFRAGWTDPLPASNADVGMTIARLLQLNPTPKGSLVGRVLSEALQTGPDASVGLVKIETLRSTAGAHGLQTVLEFERVGPTFYFDVAGFPGRTVGLD